MSKQSYVLVKQPGDISGKEFCNSFAQDFHAAGSQDGAKVVKIKPDAFRTNLYAARISGNMNSDQQALVSRFN